MKFCSSVFLSDNTDLDTFFTKYSFIISLVSIDLNWRNQLGFVIQKFEFGLWGFSNFDFRPTESFRYVGRGNLTWRVATRGELVRDTPFWQCELNGYKVWVLPQFLDN